MFKNNRLRVALPRRRDRESAGAVTAILCRHPQDEQRHGRRPGGHRSGLRRVQITTNFASMVRLARVETLRGC